MANRTRHTTARFYLLPSDGIPAVANAAEKQRRWVGGAHLERALRANASAVEEFDGEGLMLTFVWTRLGDRQAIEMPPRYFHTPLAHAMLAGFRRQDRRETYSVLTFDAVDCDGLIEQISLVTPTQSELIREQRETIIDALGPVEGESRWDDERSSIQFVELIESIVAAFQWLPARLRTISQGTTGVL
ncbi:MAG TPA: hypothetical protein VK968_11245, partial [Roseimicrobium sp.]|nr:hypothetical protein [Roseimicrobium sp.]